MFLYVFIDRKKQLGCFRLLLVVVGMMYYNHCPKQQEYVVCGFILNQFTFKDHFSLKQKSSRVFRSVLISRGKPRAKESLSLTASKKLQTN